MDVSNEQVGRALLSLAAFVLSVTFHEFGHAFVADRFGDRLPRIEGRVTLSPFKHIDPFGTIVVPLLGVFMSGVPFIAWGKPVRTNPSAMTRGFSIRVNNLLVSVAGPAMNLLVAIAVSVLLVLGTKSGLVGHDVAMGVIEFVVVLNINLMYFNMLPVPPLDGSAMLEMLMPQRWQRVLTPLYKYGGVLIMLLFISGLGSILMYPARRLGLAWARVLIGYVPE